MRRYFTKTFFKFLILFLILLAVSFGVIIFVAQSQQNDTNKANASTNTAHTSPANF